VGSHDACLATNCCHNAPVAEDEDGDNDDVERQDIPDNERPSDDGVLVHCVSVASASDYGARLEHHWRVDYNARQPSKRNC